MLTIDIVKLAAVVTGEALATTQVGRLRLEAFEIPLFIDPQSADWYGRSVHLVGPDRKEVATVVGKL